MLRPRSAHILSVLVVTVLIGVAAVEMMAIASCSTKAQPDIQGRAYLWAANAPVAVTASNFPSDLQSCVQTAFTNWNTANSTPALLAAGSSTVNAFRSPWR